jgi:hypothetical protein
MGGSARLAVQVHLNGVFLGSIDGLNDNFGVLGRFIIGLFVMGRIVSIAIYRWRRFDLCNMKGKSKVDNGLAVPVSELLRNSLVSRRGNSEKDHLSLKSVLEELENDAARP